jgi:RNA polymerase sigma-70 factor (ECF subfamily)
MAGDDQVRALLEAGNTRGAASLVIKEHGPAVLGYLRGLLRDEDLAADAFSFFAESTWSAIGRFRSESTVRTWAFGIAWNSAQRVRRQAWEKRRERFRTGEASRLAADIRTQTAVRRDREADRLAELRAALTPEEQTLLALRLEHKLDWGEIAQVLSTEAEPVTAATLRKRFERLKERLAELARQQGLMS